MNTVIDRLFPEEYDFGGAKRREAEEEAAQIRETLSDALDRDGRELLEQFLSASLRAGNAEIRDAFAQGFWTALDMMTEYRRWKHQDS